MNLYNGARCIAYPNTIATLQLHKTTRPPNAVSVATWRRNSEAVECELHYYFDCSFATVRASLLPRPDSIRTAFRIRAAVWWLLSKFVKACQNGNAPVERGGLLPLPPSLLFSRFSSVVPLFFRSFLTFHYRPRSLPMSFAEGEELGRTNSCSIDGLASLCISFPAGLRLAQYARDLGTPFL